MKNKPITFEHLYAFLGFVAILYVAFWCLRGLFGMAYEKGYFEGRMSACDEVSGTIVVNNSNEVICSIIR